MTTDAPPGAPGREVGLRPAEATPARYCLLATFAGLVLPALAAIAVLGWARSGSLQATGPGASVVVALLTVAAAVGVAILAQAGWHRLSLPQPGLGEYLPHRWLQRREALLRAQDLLAELHSLPPGASPRATALLAELASALAATDPYQRGRPERRARLSAELARELNLPDSEARRLQLAARLQDIGLAEVPSEILDQAGRLEEAEGNLVRRHPAIAAGLIGPWVEPEVTEAVATHHEHLDGGGYPRGLSGAAIPPLGALLAVVDTYDALVSDRPQRPRFSEDEAAEELRRMAGTWLAETPVAALLAVVRSHGSLSGFFPVVSKFRHAVRGTAAPLTAGLAILLVALAAWAGDLTPAPATVAAATAPPAAPATQTNPTASPEPATPAATDSPSSTGTTPSAPDAPSEASSPAAGSTPSTKSSTASNSTGKTTKTTSTTSGTTADGTSGDTGGQQAPSANNPTSRQTLSPPLIIQVPPNPDASPNPAPNPNPTQSGDPAGSGQGSTPTPSPSVGFPVIGSTSPITGPSSGGTTVTIRGSGFTGATSVNFGGTPASFQVVSDSVITAVSPPGKGVVLITVTSPRSKSSSLLALFTYTGGGIL